MPSITPDHRRHSAEYMNAESSEMKYYWGKKMMIQEVKKYEPGTQTSSVYTILIKKKKKNRKDAKDTMKLRF